LLVLPCWETFSLLEDRSGSIGAAAQKPLSAAARTIQFTRSRTDL